MQTDFITILLSDKLIQLNVIESIQPLIVPILDYDDMNSITKLETALALLNVFMENEVVLSKYKSNSSFVKSLQNVLTASEGKDECLVSNIEKIEF